MILETLIRSIGQRFAPIPSPSSGRAISTADDARRKREEARNLEQQARMLGVDIDLERAGR